MDKKDFFGPFFEKKVRFFVKKLFLEERLPRGFEITNVISEGDKKKNDVSDWNESAHLPNEWDDERKNLFCYFGCEFLDFF